MDLSESKVCGLACLNFPAVSVELPGVFRLSVEEVQVAVTVRPGEWFRFSPFISHFSVSRAEVEIRDPDRLFGGEGSFSWEDLPEFPFGEITLDRLDARIAIGGGDLWLEQVSVTGNERYTLSVGEVSYRHPRLANPFSGKGSLVIRAKKKEYVLESLAWTGDGFSLDGAGEDGQFGGSAVFDLERIVHRFDDHPPTGAVTVDYRIAVSDGKPRLAVQLRADHLRWQDFRIYEITSDFAMDPQGLTVERLVLFDRGAPVVLLDGTMTWKERVMRGKTRLKDLDFRNTLTRFGVPCWVDMWLSGSIDYSFSFETLVADYRADLSVRGFGVHTDDRFAILELADTYLVTGRGQIRPDRVVLSAAEARLADEATHVFLHDCWFDFTDSFQILISNASWIDLGRVRMIAELATAGKGAIDVSITSKYENPRIVGHFVGNDCSVAGFDTERCDLTVELKDLVLSFLGNQLTYRSIKTNGSRVAIDFNKDPIAISFLFNQVSGAVADLGGVLRTKLSDLGGRFSFTAEGRYTDHLASLVGSGQVEKTQWRGTLLADRVSVSFTDEGDLIKITKGIVSRGDSSFFLSGDMNRRTFLLDVHADLNAFFQKDFPFLTDVAFTAPRVAVAVSGPIWEPHVEADAFFGGVSYQGIAMGNFAGHLVYRAGDNRIEANGNLGDAVSFRAEVRGLDPASANAKISVRDFVHKKGDFFFKTTFDSQIAEGKISARFAKLILEKRGFFVRNNRSFTVSGDWEELTVEPVVFGGETANVLVKGSIRRGLPYLEMTGTLFPAAVSAFAGIGGISRMAGNASFKMSLADKDLSGEFVLREVGFFLPAYELAVAQMSGGISFDKGTWHIGSLSGLLNGGKIVVSGSGSFVPAWEGQVRLAVTNAGMRNPAVGPFSFSADVDTFIEQGSVSLVSGDIEIKNVSYRSDFSVAETLARSLSGKGGRSKKEDSPFERLDPRLDLRVTGRNALQVSNNILRADLVIDTRVTGTLSRPVLDGSLQLAGGEITFKQHRFSLDRGIVTFEPGEGIRAYLDIQGTTRVYARSRQTEYKLVLSVSGYADNPVVRLSSMPQLEETDAYSLLLWGDFFDPNQTGIENLAIVAATDLLGLSEEVKKNFRLTRFELTPRYSEIDYKTVLKIIAVKEIYPFLLVSIESNPADPADQMFGLTYRGGMFDLSLDWKYKNKLEADYGGVGLNLVLNLLFE